MSGPTLWVTSFAEAAEIVSSWHATYKFRLEADPKKSCFAFYMLGELDEGQGAGTAGRDARPGDVE